MTEYPVGMVRRSVFALAVGVALCGLTPSVVAQELGGIKDTLGLKLPGQGDLSAPEIKVTTTVTPKVAKPGDTVTLSIKVELPEGSYTYSMNPAFGGGTNVNFQSEEGLTPLGDFDADHPPKVEYSKEFEQDLEKYTTEVTWTRKYEVKSSATSARLKGTLNYQVCDSGSCRNLKSAFDLPVELKAEGEQPVPIGRREADAPVSDRFTQQGVFKTNKNISAFVRLTPSDAKSGDTVAVEFHLEMKDGWHVYSITQPEDNSALPTTIDVETHDGLDPIDAEFTASKDFHLVEKDDGPGKRKLIHQEYEHEVTWTRKFRLQSGVELANVRVKGKALFQTCNADRCINNSLKFELPSAETRSSATSAAPRETTEATTLTPVPEGTPLSPPSTSKVKDLSNAECVASTSEGDIRDKGVLYVLGAAFVFGWLALLTPCVFPMVPITVSFFLKQAEKKHNSPLRMALVYCASIIGTFTVLGLIVSALFGAAYINTLANGVLINLFLGIVLLFFALNLLGLFDIQVPSWLLTFTASKESTGSYFGVFFMALTFTLTSFTCTFAFLGLILVWAANGEFWWPLGGLVAFSTAFAMPFFLLALFPSYLQKLPKSGGWMNRVKVVMGLIEMAFMFKFLSVADIAWNSTPTFFDYHLVMSAWMAIAIVAGLYLIGKIQLPHDTREDYVGVLPMVIAMAFFGLAGYLGVGIFGHEPPGGFFGRQIMAFAPPRFEGGVGDDGPYLIGKHDRQKYLLEFEKARQKARRENVPLFIDFTGVNCINCREMELLMAESGIQSKLQRFVRVQLYCDKMPKEAVGDLEEGEALLESNRKLQEEWYQDTSLPGYAVVSPDGSVILSKIRGKVAASDFNTFLQCGLSKWKSNGDRLAAMAKR